MSRRWKIFTIVGVLSLIADQITKVWARHSLPSFIHDGRTYGRPVAVIENFFDWRLSMNPGAAFSLFGNISGARVFLTVIGLFAVSGILWMVHRSRNEQTRLVVALGLLAGGAIGNLYDRVVYGVVTDFIVWKYYDKEWPTFNIADVVLVIGVGLLFLDMLKEAKAESVTSKASSASKRSAASSKPRG